MIYASQISYTSFLLDAINPGAKKKKLEKFSVSVYLFSHLVTNVTLDNSITV